MSNRLIDRIARSLAADPPHDLLPGDIIEGEEDEPNPAAVLVAITDRPEPGLILTTRRDDLRTHAGQVAFPGGRIDAGETPVQAALREAHEELGLEPGQVTLFGEADPYRTVTGYCVTPVVGLVPPDLNLTPNPAEVAGWFEAPLAFVLDPANQRRMSAEFRGRTRHYYQIDWNDRRIWGATAAMLVNLARRIA
ncbi:CoA pyrophosphatase [Sphingomonas sp. RB56-2]|uniref:CoA pyrophosphatase n=1 Tax=Sphingomonas brevis TaxID=2908206 RepID=A0ABT0S8Q0_9SPHN|nr:CoA pyrophosphatase [Sphingomonas brevis]MCL6740519.1 CoA pyrophosphatase [Sphingomonas brevis]